MVFTQYVVDVANSIKLIAFSVSYAPGTVSLSTDPDGTAYVAQKSCKNLTVHNITILYQTMFLFVNQTTCSPEKTGKYFCSRKQIGDTKKRIACFCLFFSGAGICIYV